MRRITKEKSIRRLADLPMVQGGLTRLAADRVRRAGIRLEPLLSQVGLTIDEIDDPERRITASNQVAFLQAAARALNDDFLGIRLAETFDLRDLGLLYYVMSSSETLGDALARASRYSRITNEAVLLQYQEAREPRLRLHYLGISRDADLQQIEFCVVALVRLSRALSGRRFVPRHISISHPRPRGAARLAGVLGRGLEFGGGADEIDFPAGSARWPLVGADVRLNKILSDLCEETLNTRRHNSGTLRTRVENAISPLLPHGQATMTSIAKRLAMSTRTLTRRLAEEGVTFSEILQQLRARLAIRYLEAQDMPISRIAWLLGFEDASSFSHACRRWTGKSPREFRLSC
jgi:AraC-like DNA-binding protein